MAKDDPYKAQYREMRNRWGFILAAAWIVYWWHSNSADEQAALAALQPAKGFWQSWISHPVEENEIRGTFSSHMFLAVISSPLAFVVSHYFARSQVDDMRKSELAKAEQEQNEQLAQQTADLDRIRQTATSEADKAQAANERHELITRIGDVDAQLLVYETEQDQERRTRTLLNLTQFVYEIHAKFPGDKLSRLLASDDVLRQMVEHTVAHMRSLGLGKRNFFVVLSGMLPSSALLLAQEIPPNGGFTESPASARGA